MTDQMLSRFVAARRAYIASQFSNLNPMQQEAVLSTDGPLLLLAGAGSGKTTVLINRIANLIRFGSASDSNLVPDTVTEEDVLFLESLRQPISDTDRVKADFLCAVEPVAPWSIIAITFTNKAANELKDRPPGPGCLGHDIPLRLLPYSAPRSGAGGAEQAFHHL